MAKQSKKVAGDSIETVLASPAKVSKVEVTTAPEVKSVREGIRPRDHEVFVDGHKRHLSSDAITVAIQRKQNVELPKGSTYVIPDYLRESENCRGCGR